MTFDELSVVIPCHNLDDFPTQLQGADAEGLLAGWSALWHPALIAAVGKAPTWRQAEFPSDSLFGKLLVVPPVVEKSFSGDLASKAQKEGGLVIRGLTHRDEIVAALLATIGDGTDSPVGRVDAELVADFLALGTCYLYSELLVRRMRYVSTLDDGRFQEHLVAAAVAAVAGKPTDARQAIELCCNVLVESRGRYYPADTSLVDLTLAASTTIGPSLRRELAQGQPLNLLISGEVLAEMAAREPESLALLKGRLETENPNIALCGGEWREVELPLLPLEAILIGLRRGLAAYEQHVAKPPIIFARRRYGLTPALPAILRGLGFRGAIHCTLDEGKFPQADSTKTRWEGVDGAEIDAVGRVPLEAHQPGSFVQLAERMGHAMDHDHVATVCFAHWPSHTSPFYEDLRRITAIAPVFGKFVALDDYFSGTDQSGMYSRFTHDEYRAPYLPQAIATKQADPLSRWMRFYKEFSAATAAQTLDTLASLLRGSLTSDDVAEFAKNSEAQPMSPEFLANSATGEVHPARLPNAIARCASVLPRGKGNAASGYMLFNPLSFSRRVLVDLPKLDELPATQAPVKAVERSGGGARAVVELPPLGFAWIGPTAGEPGRNWSGEPLANGQTLRNEHFEINIHPTTGGIQSVHDFRSRGNRLSQQLVFCGSAEAKGDAALTPGPGAPGEREKASDEAASRMVAESIEVTDGGLLRGEITSRGQLLDAGGKRLAGFVQRVQLTLGSRVANIEIELDPAAQPAADPWNSYFAIRYAWADKAAELRRGVHLGSFVTRAKRFEAPEFVEVISNEERTLLLPGGLPFHARVGSRMLDTLLITAGETCRKFRLGIGVDLPHGWMAALEMAAPETMQFENAAPPAPVHYGWLFHLDMKNVTATHWEPLIETAGAKSEVVGFRCRLLETEGRLGRARLRCFRSPKSAQRTEFSGQSRGTLPIEDDCILIDYNGHEWVQVEARWK